MKNIKENPELFVGIELEYPVVNLEGDATDVEVIKHLFRYLVSYFDFTVEKVDDFGTPIQLVDPISQDAILFEVSYTTIEFAFGKAETIQEVENRFNNYMDVIQGKFKVNQIMLLLAVEFILTGIKMRIVQWLIHATRC